MTYLAALRGIPRTLDPLSRWLLILDRFVSSERCSEKKIAGERMRLRSWKAGTRIARLIVQRSCHCWRPGSGGESREISGRLLRRIEIVINFISSSISLLARVIRRTACSYRVPIFSPVLRSFRPGREARWRDADGPVPRAIPSYFIIDESEDYSLPLGLPTGIYDQQL